MNWKDELENKYRAKISHSFLLYLNTKDLVLCQQKLYSLEEYLVNFSPAKEAEIIAFYNRGTGLRFANKLMEEKFLELTGLGKGEFREMHKNLPVMLSYLNDLLLRNKRDAYPKQASGQSPTTKSQQEISSQNALIAVILEFTETLVPQDAPGGDKEDRGVYVLLEWWARNQTIRNNNNLIIMVVNDVLSAVPPSLRDPSSGIIPLKIDFPDLSARKEFIQILRKEFPLRKEDIADEFLANLTAGLSCATIHNIIKENYYFSKPLTPEFTFELKKKMLEEQSGGMIVIKKPLWGMKAIGALEEQKKYIEMVVRAIRENDPLSIPMGILLIGGPGTGKTVFAEALAYECGFPLIIFKNVREKWVGQSERNQDLVYELVKALAPVIAFEDEIDQETQKRNEGPGDNTGVSQRMSKRRFEFMSDTALRGKVIWLAATNRPDLLDAALLREGRFDEKIPFLPPNKEERVSIIKALLYKMGVHAKLLGQEFKHKLSEEDCREISKRSCNYYNESTKEFFKYSEERSAGELEEIPYTGAEIETILRKAYIISRDQGSDVLLLKHAEEAFDDYISTKNFEDFIYANDLSLFMTNSKKFIPEHWLKRWKQLRKKPPKNPQNIFY